MFLPPNGPFLYAILFFLTFLTVLIYVEKEKKA